MEAKKLASSTDTELKKVAVKLCNLREKRTGAIMYPSELRAFDYLCDTFMVAAAATNRNADLLMALRTKGQGAAHSGNNLTLSAYDVEDYSRCFRQAVLSLGDVLNPMSCLSYWMDEYKCDYLDGSHCLDGKMDISCDYSLDLMMD